MTIEKVLERVDRQKPNAIEDQMKEDWVLELERRNWEEMLRKDEEAQNWTAPDQKEELRIQAPFDQVYVLYVIAMIEFVTQEYASYENTMALFNSQMSDYKAWYRRNHRPKDRRILL